MINKDLSILNNIDNVVYKNDPFPYILIRNALPSELALQLTMEFPTYLFDISLNNTRLDLSSYQVKDSSEITPLWKDFIIYHSSKYFYQQLIDIFKPSLSLKNFINTLDAPMVFDI